MAFDFTEVDEIAAPAALANTYDEVVASIAKLKSQKAKWTVPLTGDELAKFKTGVKAAANRAGFSAKFGLDEPTADGTGTVVQAGLGPKGAPRGIAAKLAAQAATK